MGHDQRVLSIYGSLNVVGRKGLLTNEHKPCFRLCIFLQLLKRRLHRRVIDLCLLLGVRLVYPIDKEFALCEVSPAAYLREGIKLTDAAVIRG
jgi:hypothetical protein